MDNVHCGEVKSKLKVDKVAVQSTEGLQLLRAQWECLPVDQAPQTGLSLDDAEGQGTPIF